jgi:hypothetical protein
MTDIKVNYPWVIKGSSTSGNFGHSGRPGKHGGSKGGGGHGAIGVKPGATTKQKTKAISKHKQAKPQKQAKSKSDDDFIKTIPEHVRNSGDISSYLVNKVSSGEMDFASAQRINLQYMATKSSTVAPSSVSPKGKVYSRGELDGATQKWDKWAKGLSPTERNSMLDYQSNSWDGRKTDYTQINGYLRGETKRPTKATKQAVDGLDSSLDKSSVPEDTIVYRGLHPSVLGGKPESLIGKTIQDKGYVSTSLSRDVSKNFSNDTIAEIRVPKGAKGGYMDSVNKPEGQPEYELLLPRNSEFRVVSVEKSGKITNVVMELVQ